MEGSSSAAVERVGHKTVVAVEGEESRTDVDVVVGRLQGHCKTFVAAAGAVDKSWRRQWRRLAGNS